MAGAARVYETPLARRQHPRLALAIQRRQPRFFRLANTGCALVCESHGFEVDLVAHTYFQHRDGAH